MRSSGTLRVGVIGASHWHFKYYVTPLLEMADVRVVGVSDPDAEAARVRAEPLGAEWAADFRELCERTRPDFVFALGRHCDMAAQGEYLIERGIPFAMEKPCGIDLGEVRALADHAARRQAFAAVPFVWRQTDFMNALRDMAAEDRFEYLSLRIVSGPPDRYVQFGCSWMLDPALSGGGTTISHTVHLIDLFRALTGTHQVELCSAAMSNTSFGLPVEDWSVVVLRAGQSYCTAETGFLYPERTGYYEARFTIKSDRHYILSDPETTEILDTNGGRARVPTPAANEPTYAIFVRDVLERFRTDVAPLTDLSDMADVMAVVDRAYDLASSSGAQACNTGRVPS